MFRSVHLCFIVVSFSWVCSGQTLAQTPPELSPPPDPQQSCDAFSLTNYPRFSFKQRTCYWGSQLFTGSALFGASFFAAVAQVRHDPKEWPQGAQGFGERFGTRYTQGMTKTTVAYLASAMLHEDLRPRPPYDPACPGHVHIPHTNYMARLGSSLLRVVWTHNDATCKDQVAVSRLAGSFASGFIQSAWLPPSTNTTGNALVSSASGMGGYFANSVWTEFQGDLFGLLGRAFGLGKPKTVTKTTSPKPSAGGSE